MSEYETLERIQDRLERVHTHVIDIEEQLIEAGREDLMDEYEPIRAALDEFLVTLAAEVDRLTDDGEADGDVL